MERKSIPTLALLLLSASLVVARPAWAADSPILASDLLAFFGSSCPTQGEWTRAALGQAQSLVMSLQALKDDQDCKTTAGAIGELNVLQQRIQSIQNRGAAAGQLANLRGQEQELMLQLGRSTDPGEKSIIQDQLRNTQAAIAGAISQQREEEQAYATKHVEVLSQIVVGTNTLMAQATANQGCLLKHPSLVTGIVTLAGTIASAATIANPALSLGIAAGTQLLAGMIEYSRQYAMATKIRKMNAAVTAASLQCVMESLSNQWCRTQDALQVLALRDRARQEPVQGGSLISAVRLVDREIPIFLRWLQRIRAGADPGNVSDADRQARVIKREARVRSANAGGIGILAEQEPLFDLADNPRAKWDSERQAINKILGAIFREAGCESMSECIPDHPFFDVHNSASAPYHLLGLEPAQYPRTNDGILFPFRDFDPFSQWPTGAGKFSPDFHLVRERFTSWAEEARNRVANEMNNVMQPDALAVVHSALDPTTGPRKTSALQSIQTLRAFLHDHPPKDFKFGSFKKVYEDSIARLEAIEFQIRRVVDPIPPARMLELLNSPISGREHEIAKDALKVIADQAALQWGTFVFKSRLDLAVRLALLELFSGSSIVDQDTAAQFLAADQMLDILEKISGTTDQAKIKEDLNQAKPIIQDTTQAFLAVFGKPVRQVLEHFEEMERRTPGSSGLVYRDNRAKMCLKLLSAPEWPRAIPKKLCTGLRLEPIFTHGPASVTITEAEYLRPHDQRACHYRDFLRRSKIYEDYLENPGPVIPPR